MNFTQKVCELGRNGLSPKAIVEEMDIVQKGYRPLWPVNDETDPVTGRVLRKGKTDKELSAMAYQKVYGILKEAGIVVASERKSYNLDALVW